MKVEEILFYNPFQGLNKRRSIVLAIQRSGLFLCYMRKGLIRPKVIITKRIPSEDEYPSASLVVNTLLSIFPNTAGKRLILLLPDEWVYTTSIKMPGAVLENLSDVVRMEMDRVTPFRAEDVYYDYRVLQSNDQITLGLAIVSKEKIKPYIEALLESGILPDCLSFESAVMGELFSMSNGSADFILLEKKGLGYKRVSFQNSFPVLTEIVSTQEASSSNEPKPEVVYHLEEKLSFKGISLNGLSGEDRSKAAALSFLYSDRNINLLTYGNRPDREKPLRLTVILLFIIITLFGIQQYIPMIRLNKEVYALDRIVKKLKPQAKQRENILEELKVLKEKLNKLREYKKGVKKIDLLLDITERIPENTWLTGFNIRKNTVELQGYSEDATGLISILEGSPYLKNLTFSSPTYKDLRMNKERFRIRAELEIK